MPEYDAASRSFKGSEGSGGAQIFDTSSTPQFLQRQIGLEQQAVAKKAKAQANLEKARGLINPKLPKAVYDQHIRQEIMPRWEAYTKSLYDNPNMTAEEMAAKKIEGQQILTDWELGTVAYNEIQKKIATYEALYAKADGTIDKEAIKRNIEILNNRLDPKNKDPENFAKYENILAYQANVDDKELNSELKFHDPIKQTQDWMKDIKGVTRTWNEATGVEDVDYASLFKETTDWSKESLDKMMSKTASDFVRFKDKRMKGGITQGEFFAQQAKEKGVTPLKAYQDYVLGTANADKFRVYYDKINNRQSFGDKEKEQLSSTQGVDTRKVTLFTPNPENPNKKQAPVDFQAPIVYGVTLNTGKSGKEPYTLTNVETVDMDGNDNKHNESVVIVGAGELKLAKTQVVENGKLSDPRIYIITPKNEMTDRNGNKYSKYNGDAIGIRVTSSVIKQLRVRDLEIETKIANLNNSWTKANKVASTENKAIDKGKKSTKGTAKNNTIGKKPEL